MTSSPTRVSESSRRRSSDPITWYLATIGRDKVGFSPQPGGPDAREPQYVGGVRGVVGK